CRFSGNESAYVVCGGCGCWGSGASFGGGRVEPSRRMTGGTGCGAPAGGGGGGFGLGVGEGGFGMGGVVPNGGGAGMARAGSTRSARPGSSSRRATPSAGRPSSCIAVLGWRRASTSANRTAFDVSAEDEQRHPWPVGELHVVGRVLDGGGRDVVVPAAPVIPGEQEDGGVPAALLDDGVDGLPGGVLSFLLLRRRRPPLRPRRHRAPVGPEARARPALARRAGAVALDLMDGASHGRDRFAASSSPNRRRRARGDG